MRSIHTLLACLLILGCASDPHDDVQDVELVTQTDVPYLPGGSSDDYATLDLYYTPDGTPKRVLVFVHGGSWVGGDKSNVETAPALIDWFVERNFVIAAPNFRLASPLGQPSVVTYAQQETDIANALAWLRDHDSELSIDASGMVLLGYSSGAHLVALLAADSSYLESAGLSVDDVAGAISFDVHAYDVPYALELMEGSVVENNIPLIEHLFGDTEPEQLAGSPSHYAPTADVPPSLLVSAEPSAQPGSHGYVSLHATQAYVQLLQDTGHQATLEHFDGETHNSLVADFGTEADGPTAAVASFLESLE